MLRRKRYSGGLETLKPIEEASDPYEAVGIWWARAILQGKFDDGNTTQAGIRSRERAQEEHLQRRNQIEAAIGGFAQALGATARKRHIHAIEVDGATHSALIRAAELSDMPTTETSTFPWESMTSVKDGVVIAKLGHSGTEKQVWPPEPVEN